MTENLNAGSDKTFSEGAVCQQLHGEGYYSRVAVFKPFITKMNAHLGPKKHKLWSTEIYKKVLWSDESSPSSALIKWASACVSYTETIVQT